MGVKARFAVAVAAVLGVLAPTAASAHGQRHDHRGGPELSDPLVDGLVGPLSLAIGHKGKVYVAEEFAGTFGKVRGGAYEPLETRPGEGIAGLSVGPMGGVYFTSTISDDEGPIASSLWRWYRGTSTQLADVRAWEDANNPDAINTYGFTDLDPDCEASLPPELATYTGLLDSHPYQTVVAFGRIYIADAGANAILEVRLDGSIRAVAVLPPQQLEVTQELADAQGLPPCVVGHSFGFEPVPTDVEVGPGGMLYVTTLPGGPEDPSLGARGAVWKVNPRTGAFQRIASGLAGPTNLAIGRSGIYVTELFANRVSVLRHGQPVPVLELTEPAAIEAFRGKLYVTYDVFTSGKVAVIS